jgi:hypothetical protein
MRGITARVEARRESTDDPPLRVGFCTNEVAAAKVAGFDYAEIGIRDFAALLHVEFETLVRAHRATGLPTEAGYVFLPADLKIVVVPRLPARRMDTCP